MNDLIFLVERNDSIGGERLRFEVYLSQIRIVRMRDNEELLALPNDEHGRAQKIMLTLWDQLTIKESERDTIPPYWTN